MYLVSWRQILVIILATAALLSAALVSAYLYMQNLDLPVVKRSQGKCLQVVNYRNGEGFVCQDVDVTLRRYRVEEASSAPREEPKAPSL